MKTINAAIRPNGNLAQALATRRDKGWNTGSIKRQSRRQMRQRLAADLRHEFSAFVVSENRQRQFQSWFDHDWKLSATLTAQQATVSATAGARVIRAVQATSKAAVSPFVRKQARVAVLAA